MIRLVAMTVLVWSVAGGVLAQPKDNSPFSRFGLGDFFPQPFAALQGMGGLTAAFSDPLHVNAQNAASLGYLETAAFEVGLNAEFSSLELNNQSNPIRSGGLSYLSLGFPMFNPLNEVLERRKRPLEWGMNFSLQPYTNVGYDIQTLETLPNQDTTVNVFRGSGGTTRFLWGNGFRYKNLAVGLNLGFLFGNIEHERQAKYTELIASYDNDFQDDISVRGFVWNAGIQYRLALNADARGGEGADLRKARFLYLGFYGNSQTDFTTRSTRLRIRRNDNFGLLGRDTILFEENVKEKGKLPAEYTLGIIYQQGSKFRFGGDFSLGKWSKFTSPALPGTLTDGWRLSFGAEFVPDFASYNNYFRRIRYRLGFYYHDDPRTDELRQSALSLGFGLPVIMPRQQTSYVNLTFEVGKFGEAGFIDERFFRISAGFTLNDNTWFFKRKFN